MYRHTSSSLFLPCEQTADGAATWRDVDALQPSRLTSRQREHEDILHWTVRGTRV